MLATLIGTLINAIKESAIHAAAKHFLNTVISKVIKEVSDD